MVALLIKLCNKLALGNIIITPVRVTGGLLHKMYHVITDKGNYAIKLLNPDIMQREYALKNMISSEEISNNLSTEIPLIVAREFDGKYVIELDDYFFIIYDWMDATSLFGNDIESCHCEEIGKVLGKIHFLDIDISSIKKESNVRDIFDWNYFLKESQKNNIVWCKVYEENIEKIILWDKNAISSLKALSSNQVISHRDLDPKNVLWKQGKPYIIDWEAAGFINPYQELVEVLNYWTVDSSGEYNKVKLMALLKEYRKLNEISDVDWDAVLCCSFDGMLGWLEYNIKRALGLEGNDSTNIKDGVEQLLSTINELNRYQLRMNSLKGWLNEYT